MPAVRRRLDPARRRADILDAAGAAFAAAPFDRVAVTQVADDAGASEALVHRYFGSKAGLYLAVVRRAVDALVDRQLAADAALPPGTPAQTRLATSLEVYLDFVASAPQGWASPLRGVGGEPSAAAELRAELRQRYVDLLCRLLGLRRSRDVGLALHGYLGFVDAACLAWVEDGLDEGGRRTVVLTAVGALRGALDAAGVRPTLIPGADPGR